jgi:hypothetical protein
VSAARTTRTSRREVVLVVFAGAMLAAGALSVVLAGQRANAADEDAIRVVSGCTSTVTLPSAGRYLVSIEVAGPSLSTTQACREIAAGPRVGVLTGVQLSSESGATASLPLSEVNASRVVAGGQRGSLGVVDVDAEGEFVIKVEASGDVVATIGADPSAIRSNGWRWGVGWLVGVLIAGLLVVRPSARSRSQTADGALWAAPLPADRIG